MIQNYIINEILKSPLPIYLDINEENIFYNEPDSIIVIIRGTKYSIVEVEYILDYFKRTKEVARFVDDIIIEANKIKVQICPPIRY